LDFVPSPRGLLYYFCSSDERPEIRAIDPASGKTFHVDSGEFADLAVSPQGDRIAFVRSDSMSSTVWTMRLNPTTGKTEGAPRRLSIGYGRGPSFSPDGRFIAFTTLPPSDTLVEPRIMRVPVAGGPEEVIVREPGFAFPIFWSPDGNWIYYHHGLRSVHTLRRTPAGGGKSEILGPSSNVIALSPDGRWIAHTLPGSPQARETVMIADQRGRELHRFTLPSGMGRFVWGTGNRLFGVRYQSLFAAHFADLNGKIVEVLPPAPSHQNFEITADRREARFSASSEQEHGQAVVDLLTRGVRYLSTDAPAPEVLRTEDSSRAAPTANPATKAPGKASGTVCSPVYIGNERPPFTSPIRACRQGNTLVVRGAEPRLGRPSVRHVPLVADDPLLVLRADDSTAVIVKAYEVLTLPLGKGEPRVIYTATTGSRILPAASSISPDSRWTAIVSVAASFPITTTLQLIPLASGSTRTLTLPTDPVGMTYWDQSQRFVAFVGDYKTAWHVWLQPLNGDAPFTLTGAEANGIPSGRCCGWAPDGSGVLYTLESATRASLWSIDLAPLLSSPTVIKR
jgi:Tol biopolymer transport system component